MTFLLLLLTEEGGAAHGSLGASITVDEGNKPESEGHRPSSSVFPRAMPAVTARATWLNPGLHLLPLSQGASPPLLLSLMAS